VNTPLPPDRIDLLLGGYATGTLTPEEHQALMQSALQNQALFDALMDEEALRETLADPQTRADLLRALLPQPQPVAWWRKPWPWAALATATAAAALFVLLRPQPHQPEIAMHKAAQAPAGEIAANLTKPVPVPSEIATPKSLRVAEPERVFARPVKSKDARLAEPLEDRRAASNEVSAERAAKPAVQGVIAGAMPSNVPGSAAALPMAPTAPPPPAPAAIRQEAAAPARAEADLQLAKKETAQSALDVQIAVQREDGTWLGRAAGVALPAGKPVRLTLTSSTPGYVSLAPPLAGPVAVEAGVPTHVVLPAQKAGELALRLGFSPGVVARDNVGMGLRAAKTRADAAHSAAVPMRAAEGQPGAAVVAVRELRLKFE